MVSPTAVKSADLRALWLVLSKAAWWVYWAEMKASMMAVQSDVMILGDKKVVAVLLYLNHKILKLRNIDFPRYMKTLSYQSQQ